LRERQILKPALPACGECGAVQTGWRDLHTGGWDDQADDDGAWIEARFDANYSGELKSLQESVLGARSYRLSVRDARLRDVRKTARAPSTEGQAGKEPLELGQLDGVTVVHRDAEVGPERMYSLTLHDVRLHQWDHASVEEEAGDDAALVGRVWGRLYARLKPLKARQEPFDENGHPASRRQDAAATDPLTPGAAGREASRAGATDDAQDAAGGPAHGAGRAAPIGEDLGFDDDLAIGAARRDALLLNGTADDAAASGAAPSAASATTAATGTAWSGPASGAAGAAAHAQTRARARGAGVWQRLGAAWRRTQPPGFFSGTVWLWLALLCGFLTLVCRWPAVVGALLLLVLLRFLMRARLQPAWLPSHYPAWFAAARHRWGWLAALLAIGAALWIFSRIAHTVSVCTDVPAGWFAGLAMLLLATALLRRRLAAVIVGAIGLVALILVYHREPVGCGQTLAQAVRTSVAALPQRLVDHGAAEDHDAAMVAAQDAGARGRRISIDQALAHPHDYFDCAGAAAKDGGQPFEIYVGESALFAFKQARLGADSGAHLHKIAELIATNPQARLVLTGHSDKTGSALLNLKLSEQRAQSVADWLVQNGAAAPEQIDVRGAGDREPVVDDPLLYRLNRRVELRIDCAAHQGEPQ
jgi:outer membrane protein OmpA-like peptidoglycan-associated protein